VIIASYCGDPVTDRLMREAVQRVRLALQGMPQRIGLIEPPALTLRPMRELGGVSMGLQSEQDYSESIVISPWYIDDGRAYPVRPDHIQFITLHEIAHWLISHAGGEDTWAHGPAFTALNATLIMRYDPTLVRKIDLYDVGFDSQDTFTSGRPVWAADGAGWSLFIPWALRTARRYSSTDWAADRIASAVLKSNRHFTGQARPRHYQRLHDIVSGRVIEKRIIAERDREIDSLRKRLAVKQPPTATEERGRDDSGWFWLSMVFLMIFGIYLITGQIT
jgi:hypothetical protein